MPATQINYNRYAPKAVHGQVADTHPHATDTRSNTNATAIKFGTPVSEGNTSDGEWTCQPFVASNNTEAQDFVGVAVKNIVQGNADDEYKQYANVDVLVRGDVYLQVATAVAAGGRVAWNSETSTTSNNGWNDESGVANAATRNNVIAGARWMTSASAGGLAIARFDGTLK